MEVAIREAGPADSPALTDLATHLGGPDDPSSLVAGFESLIAHPDHLVLVAVAADGEIVGWVHAFIARRVQALPFVEIGGLVVVPAHRRSGIGSSLCRRVALWAEGVGVSRLRVRSRSDRTDAASFFETIGFSRTKTQSVFDASGAASGSTDP